MDVTIVVAFDNKLGIGKDNQLLWHLPNDLKQFKNLTTNGVILMGRKTYDSIGRALPNRLNIIVSRNKNLEIAKCKVVNTIEKGVEIAKTEGYDEVFIIGGAQLYEQSIKISNKLIITHVDANCQADAFFPSINFKEWALIDTKTFAKDEKHLYDFKIKTYKRN